ncbi:MAG: copper-binding protein, partial [Planctomycetes bacterium]|nr:copper-binding protein [Planctomycetota bacterium]
MHFSTTSPPPLSGERLFARVRPLLAGVQTPAWYVGGEVTKIDKAAGRIEIRHGEIKALDMPPMRMVFRVREPRMLEG